jgi:adenosyl cobinamide kinase/adenosyl cobinamide phosphate guanylyltransferase
MALVVITGGARSGKSGAAQRLAESRSAEGQPVVVAVFASESDAEMTDRIARHRADRAPGFSVVEATGSAGWLGGVPVGSLLLVDCLGTCLGLALEEAWAETSSADTAMSDTVELPAGCAVAFETRSTALVDALAARTDDTIIVTNEVGAGVVPAFATGRIFRDELGRANAALIAIADAAYLAVGGRLLDLAALPRDAAWPED